MDKSMICPRCLKNLHHGVHTCTPTPLVRELETEATRLRAELEHAREERDSWRGGCDWRDAEITRLRAELAGMTDHRRAYMERAERWKASCARAVAELAECKRDAERYRWLREKIENDDFLIARVSDWGLTSWCGDDPDRYIDAALAAKGE